MYCLIRIVRERELDGGYRYIIGTSRAIEEAFDRRLRELRLRRVTDVNIEGGLAGRFGVNWMIGWRNRGKVAWREHWSLVFPDDWDFRRAGKRAVWVFEREETPSPCRPAGCATPPGGIFKRKAI